MKGYYKKISYSFIAEENQVYAWDPPVSPLDALSSAS